MFESVVERIAQQGEEGASKCGDATTDPSLAALALPVFEEGAAVPYVDHGDLEGQLAVVEYLLDAGWCKAEGTDEPLGDVVRRSLEGWLAHSWGGLEYFDFSFTVERCLGHCLVGASSDDLEAWEGAIQADLGVNWREPCIPISVNTSGQRWLKVGPGVRSLEAEVAGLGWAVLDAVSRVGIQVGMCDLSFHEYAASEAFWMSGESEEDWAGETGESLDTFEGMTRAEFEAGIPVQLARKAKPISDEELLDLAKREDRVGLAARGLARLRSYEQTDDPFGLPSIHEAMDAGVCMDVGVVIVWDEKAPVVRVLDTYMRPYQEGEGGRYELGAIALGLGDPEAMMRHTQRWECMSQQVRVADELLGLIAEEVE